MRRLLRRAALVALAITLLAVTLLWAVLLPPPAPVPARGARLEGVTLVEPGRARTSGRTILVEGDRIASIAPTEAPAAAPEAGLFALPGLVDLHVHHPSLLTPGERELFALLFLFHGVTTVRDTGELFGSLEGHRRRIARGRRAGPRVLRCGPVVDGQPASWPGARAVDGPTAARAAVQALAADGVDCIKAYNYLDRPSLDALRAAAVAAGLPLVGHVPFDVDFRALESMEVQHFMGLTEDWSVLRDAELDRYAEHSRSHGLSHTPTLYAFDRASRLDRLDELRRDPALRWLPRYYAVFLWDPAHNPLVDLQSPMAGEDARVRPEGMARALRALREAGVPVHVGTDTLNAFVVPGASLHAELRAWVEAGYTPDEVWALATRAAGEVLGMPQLGRLEVGAPADLLLFREDPTLDLAALDTLEGVVADGRRYSRAELERALERQRRHFRARVYDAVTLQAARAATAAMERLTR